MKSILLTNSNYTAIVDDDMYDVLSKRKWILSNGYAITSGYKIKMHRLIMNITDPKILVDHIDCDKLNNTKENLRLANHKENVHNQKKRGGTKNNYKGVCFHKNLNAFQARCRMNGGDFFLGYYKSEIAAAHAFNIKAKQVSKFALINKLNTPIETLDLLIISDRLRPKLRIKDSGHKGVTWHNQQKRWRVRININGKNKQIGRFKNKKQAIESYKNFKIVDDANEKFLNS